MQPSKHNGQVMLFQLKGERINIPDQHISQLLKQSLHNLTWVEILTCPDYSVSRLIDTVGDHVGVTLYMNESKNALKLLALRYTRKQKLLIKAHPKGQGKWNTSLLHVSKALAALPDRFYDEKLIDFTFLVRIFDHQVDIHEHSLQQILCRFCRRHDIMKLGEAANELTGHNSIFTPTSYHDVLAKRLFWNSAYSPFNFVVQIKPEAKQMAARVLETLLLSN